MGGVEKRIAIAEIVSNRWFNPETEKPRYTPIINLLAVNFCPYCLLKEFTTVTCQPLCDIDNSVVAQLQTQLPKSINGDPW